MSPVKVKTVMFSIIFPVKCLNSRLFFPCNFLVLVMTYNLARSIEANKLSGRYLNWLLPKFLQYVNILTAVASYLLCYNFYMSANKGVDEKLPSSIKLIRFEEMSLCAMITEKYL